MPFWWNDAGKLAKRSDKNCHLIWAWACKDDRSFCTFRPPTVWHAFLNWFLFVRFNPTEAMCWPFLCLFCVESLRLQQSLCCPSVNECLGLWSPFPSKTILVSWAHGFGRLLDQGSETAKPVNIFVANYLVWRVTGANLLWKKILLTSYCLVHWFDMREKYY